MPIHWTSQQTSSSPGSHGAAPASSELRGAILAAGLGRRLEPLTRHLLPKPMFPIGGKLPMVELWARRLQKAGVGELCMNVCVLEQTLIEHFGRGERLGVDLSFVSEPEPSGTLGGVCKQVLGAAAKVLPGESPLESPSPFQGSTVIVPSGDIVTNLAPELIQEVLHLHRAQGAALSLVVTPIPPERRKDFGTVVLEREIERNGPLSMYGRVERFAEKDPDSPSILNNASIYVIERSLIEELDQLRTGIGSDAPPFYDFGKHVFPALLGKLDYAKLSGSDYPIFAVRYDGGWFDVGNKRDYLLVHQTLLDGEIDVPSVYEEMPWGAIGIDVDMDFSKVEIRPPVVIGHRCRIEPGAVIGPYAVIGDDWQVAAGARIENSVLWERYPFQSASGRRISARDRVELDPHRIGAVTVRGSIVAGGAIETDLIDQTAQVLEDGELEVSSIDWVPSGPRA